MNYSVIFFAVLSIILVLLSKFYGLSILYPTLLIIFTIILDLIINTINAKREKKEHNRLDEIIKKNKKGS